MLKSKWILLSLVAVVAMIGFAGCGKEDTSGTITTPTGQTKDIPATKPGGASGAGAEQPKAGLDPGK